VPVGASEAAENGVERAEPGKDPPDGIARVADGDEAADEHDRQVVEREQDALVRRRQPQPTAIEPAPASAATPAHTPAS
jgi:hypothetical protein